MSNYYRTLASFFQSLPSRSLWRGLLLCVLIQTAAQAEPGNSVEPPAQADQHQPAASVMPADPQHAGSTEKNVTLPSYSATYSATKSGISANLKQTLKPINHNQWRLHNETSILFFSFEEEAVFSIQDNRIKPLIYRYDNSTNSSRSSQLAFDWQKQTVFDQLHSKKPLQLQEPAWDKLSVQAQIRLDLLRQGDAYQKEEYQQIDRTKLKRYTITRLKDEVLNTQLGPFDTIKLEERRDGRDKYTLIWLAKNHDYMILRLQRIEDGEVEYQIDLSDATINGKPLKGH